MLVVAAAAGLGCSVAMGQAKLAVYGEVGAERSGISGQTWTLAETGGAYLRLKNLGPVAVAIDGRGVFSSDTNSILAGPRVALHLPLFPLKPYVEGLGGVVFYGSNATARSEGRKDANDFAYRFVAGVDETIFYHLDWRIVEFGYGGGVTQLNQNVHTRNLSTGLVVRF